VSGDTGLSARLSFKSRLGKTPKTNTCTGALIYRLFSQELDCSSKFAKFQVCKQILMLYADYDVTLVQLSDVIPCLLQSSSMTMMIFIIICSICSSNT